MNAPLGVLTVAGSDSGGGAGIQADLKTFFSLGVHGMSALTAVTVQDNLGVHSVHPLPPVVVAGQIAAAGRIGIAAAKTGMLATAGIVSAAASELKALGVENLVVDPVTVSGLGQPLLTGEGLRTLAAELLPLALVATPNLQEASQITGLEVSAPGSMREAARRIHGLGAGFVVVTGGHLSGPPVDVLFDGSSFELLGGERIPSPHSHGGGCTFSAAIAAFLALGSGVPEAVLDAKRFVEEAIRGGFELGGRPGPVYQRAGRLRRSG